MTRPLPDDIATALDRLVVTSADFATCPDGNFDASFARHTAARAALERAIAAHMPPVAQ